MNPLRLIFILEEADPTFRDLFFPSHLRCPLSKRIAQAIDEHWPAYFPTRKECRGSSWTLSIPENEPPYRPSPKSVKKLADWKKSIKGTIAEMRACQADISWKRFTKICRNSRRLSIWLNDFRSLTDFLIYEESLWPKHGGVLVGQKDYFLRQMRALLSAGSPYLHSAPIRLRFLNSSKSIPEKLRLIQLMRSLFDRPLMILAVLQKCTYESEHSTFWLPIETHISAIIKKPSPLTFRKTWLEHAMQVSDAKSKTGKSVPRKWAKLLVAKNDPDVNVINAKAVEVHDWLHGKKQPSMENIRHAGRIVFSKSKLNVSQAKAGRDLWLFSWMVSLWLEKHFQEISAEFKGDSRKIQAYYRRFFHYLKLASQDKNRKGAGGLYARQPCD